MRKRVQRWEDSYVMSVHRDAALRSRAVAAVCVCRRCCCCAMAAGCDAMPRNATWKQQQCPIQPSFWHAAACTRADGFEEGGGLSADGGAGSRAARRGGSTKGGVDRGGSSRPSSPAVSAAASASVPSYGPPCAHGGIKACQSPIGKGDELTPTALSRSRARSDVRLPVLAASASSPNPSSAAMSMLRWMMPRPVIALIERYFNPTIPLRRRLLYVVPPSMLVGAGMELFMIQTGFCTHHSA